MKAIKIYPEDIAMVEWSEEWITFIKKFGYIDTMRMWSYVLVIPILEED